VVVAVAMLVIVALRETIILLIDLVSPPCYHVAQFHGSSRTVVSEVVVGVLREEVVLEQRMTSFTVMLVMVAHISKKCLV
jgi:hypothetical protein